MPLKILVAPDKFKGTLTALEAAQSIARGWAVARPRDQLDLMPMSDGGDGFGEVMGQQLGARPQWARTVDAAHRPIEAPWWWHEEGGTAIVESARIIGLAMLPYRQFHPFDLDSFGLGEVLKAAARHGCRRCLMGIGGSATNDGGFGLGRALGWRFHTASGDPIKSWTGLEHLARVEAPDRTRWFDELLVAVDVQNPLLGPGGCSRVYGPQKGLIEFEKAEACLGRMAEVLESIQHRTHATVPGAGAAGGLGFGLLSFAEARLAPGFDLFRERTGLADRIRNAQLVITGEGALDHQTLMGKGVGEIGRLCRAEKVPCLALAGVLEDRAQARERFEDALAITPELTDRESALRSPGFWLEQLAARAAEQWTGRPS